MACVDDALKTGTAVGTFMFTLAGALATIGGIIGAPVTGGASLAAGAAAVGAISGAAATGVRAAVGKPCLSPAVKGVDAATTVIKSLKEPLNAAGQLLGG